MAELPQDHHPDAYDAGDHQQKSEAMGQDRNILNAIRSDEESPSENATTPGQQ